MKQFFILSVSLLVPSFAHAMTSTDLERELMLSITDDVRTRVFTDALQRIKDLVELRDQDILPEKNRLFEEFKREQPSIEGVKDIKKALLTKRRKKFGNGFGSYPELEADIEFKLSKKFDAKFQAMQAKAAEPYNYNWSLHRMLLERNLALKIKRYDPLNTLQGDSETTFLIEAVKKNNCGYACKLIEEGASVYVCDASGKDPIDYAHESENSTMIAMIQNAAVNQNRAESEKAERYS